MTSNTTTTTSSAPNSSSIKRQFLLVSAIIGCITIYYISDFLSLNVKVTYNDDDCQLITGIGPGSEDIVVVDNDLALVSAGDLNRQFFKSGDEPRDGGIFAIHFKDDEENNVAVERVTLEGFPDDDVLNAHGISYSNKTQRVYAVSHNCGKRTSESIEIFKLVRRNNNNNNNTLSSVTLIHEYSLRSPSSFPLGALNDVIEGTTLGEIYVTQWLPHPINDRCVGHDDAIRETTTMLNALFRRLTKVHRCVWDPATAETTNKISKVVAPHCRVVAEGFKMANGIATDPSRRRVFVADSLDKKLHVFARRVEDGALVPREVVTLSHDLDNVEYDVSADKLTLSGAPLKYQSLGRSKFGSRVTVGGGMMTVEKRSTNDGMSYVVDEVLMHDGSKLSMISSAVFWHGRVLLGSPVSDGVLMCPIPQRRA